MSINLAKTDNFTLGELSIQPRLIVVSAGDRKVKLEPRVMQVLVLLARNAGEPVSRDDMIAHCWDGVIVGEDAIQRCIGRLRRLASQTDGFAIETIPKIGYRLVADSDFTKRASANGDQEARSLPSLGFAPAKFRGIAPRGDELAQLMSGDVAAALSLNRDVVVHSPDVERDTQFVAAIELRQADDELRAHCSLTHAPSGRIAWSEAVSITPGLETLNSGVPDDQAVVDLASRFGAMLQREITEASLAKEQAQSAWQAVVRANAAYQRIDLPNISRAIEEARTAVAMDPRYPAAHAALANALAAHYELGGALVQGEADEARKHCDLALALAPEDANVLAWTAHALLMVTRPAEGLLLAEKAVSLAPWHPIANLYLARHYLHHGRPVDALDALDAHARVAPLFPWKYFPILNRGLARFMMGDIEAAESHLREAASLNPVYPYCWIALMVLGSVKGDAQMMRSAAGRLRQLEGNNDLALQLARLAHSYPGSEQAVMIQEAFQAAWKA